MKKDRKSRLTLPLLICLVVIASAVGATLIFTNRNEVIPTLINVGHNDSIGVDAIPEIEQGDIFHNGDEPFGSIIELKGRHILEEDTVIFKIGVGEILAKDGIMAYARFSDPILLFKQPEMKSFKWVGKPGQGPGEYLDPQLIFTTDSSAICYIVDKIKYKLMFILNKDYSIQQIESPLKHLPSRSIGEYIYHLGGSEFIYVAQNNGVSLDIQSSSISNDTVCTRHIYNTTLNGEEAGWQFAFLGSFAANKNQNRMVYAYRFYRILKFMDLEGKNVRTLHFKNEKGYDHETKNIAEGLDHNAIYYRRIYAQEKYVYVWNNGGRTPIQAYKDDKNGNRYLYIEQYDWNGNPIRKYKLDQSGYFTVDEKNKKLYLASSLYDNPFFVYDLP